MSENQTSVNPRLVEQIVTPFIDSIVCGDNVATMKQLPDECIDLTVTSPPYDDLRTYGGHAWDFEGVARELFRVTKKGGVVVWVVADATIDGSETGTSFRQALFFKEIGFNLHDTMIYKKVGVGSSGSNLGYPQAFEYMFVFSKERPKTVNHIKDVENADAGQLRKYAKTKSDAKGYLKDMVSKEVFKNTKRDNVWHYCVGFANSSDSNAHPAAFPEGISQDHIHSWSNKGDLVLDPFSGSGTTCKMAKELGRHFIGLEVNPAYVEISNQRMRQEVLCL